MNMKPVEYPVMLSGKNMEWTPNVYEVGADYISSLEKIILLPITLTSITLLNSSNKLLIRIWKAEKHINLLLLSSGFLLQLLSGSG